MDLPRDIFEEIKSMRSSVSDKECQTLFPRVTKLDITSLSHRYSDTSGFSVKQPGQL